MSADNARDTSLVGPGDYTRGGTTERTDGSGNTCRPPPSTALQCASFQPVVLAPSVAIRMKTMTQG